MTTLSIHRRLKEGLAPILQPKRDDNAVLKVRFGIARVARSS
jgi:hypothetical protein